MSTISPVALLCEKTRIFLQSRHAAPNARGHSFHDDRYRPRSCRWQQRAKADGRGAHPPTKPMSPDPSLSGLHESVATVQLERRRWRNFVPVRRVLERALTHLEARINRSRCGLYCNGQQQKVTVTFCVHSSECIPANFTEFQGSDIAQIWAYISRATLGLAR